MKDCFVDSECMKFVTQKAIPEIMMKVFVEIQGEEKFHSGYIFVLLLNCGIHQCARFKSIGANALTSAGMCFRKKSGTGIVARVYFYFRGPWHNFRSGTQFVPPT